MVQYVVYISDHAMHTWKKIIFCGCKELSSEISIRTKWFIVLFKSMWFLILLFVGLIF